MTPELPRPRMEIRELFGEAVAGLTQRPGRSALTALGTMLGIAVLTSVLGLTATAQAQISKRFDLLAATEVTVRQLPGSVRVADLAFPEDAESRVGRIAGVVASGVSWRVPKTKARTVRALPPGAAAPDGVDPPVELVAASPGALQVMRPRLATGRTYDAYAESTAARVAVLGAAVARQLGVTRVDGSRTIYVDGVALTVVGILADVGRHPDAVTAVLVPTRTAVQVWGTPEPENPAEMYVEVTPGAAGVVGDQVRLALRPDAPQRFAVRVPPDLRTLRDQVRGDLGVLFLLLAAVSLVVGVVGIANTTLVSVLERVPEIGLRRALGAARHHVAGQFLLESGVLGAVGGLVGTSVGLLLVVVVAVVRDWTAVVPTWSVVVGPLTGLLTGLLAGAYPALRAARIEPVDALRR